MDDNNSNNGSSLPPTVLSEEQWALFDRQGYVNLGRVVSDAALQRLQQRVDELMMGEVRHEDLLMQLDPGGSYGDSVMTKSTQTAGWKGATLEYRKIGEAGCGLELDDVFMEHMCGPLYKHICARVYGNGVPISTYRSMVMNKPANKGTYLPWHQDGGTWWGLDQPPLCFVWLALDSASKENGCVEAIPGTHKHGLMSERGHTLSPEHIEKYCGPENVHYLELPAGHAVLCHNWLVHQSGVNKADVPRRGFSCNYINANTRVRDEGPLGDIGRPGQQFTPVLFTTSHQ
eukprot:TRINITY_DN7270_c0_g2_i1.p1 TRINITY_DN7270_c0_g2~~TRINITY_DN7270_c0_g2_i1.p1  ORF type:complete len:288 (+),score=38.62 TRINITY_DN7270_c0_g2_i1:1-864(+)